MILKPTRLRDSFINIYFHGQGYRGGRSRHFYPLIATSQLTQLYHTDNYQMTRIDKTRHPIGNTLRLNLSV